MPANASAKYQLFAERPCDARLPLGELVDAFEFARFAPIQIVRDERPERAVIPNDLVVPELVRFAHRLAPNVSEGQLRGGAPLLSEWNELDPRAEPRPPVTIDVDDLDEFLARPTVKLPGSEEELTPPPAAIRELLARGETTFGGEEMDQPVVIRAPRDHAREDCDQGPITVDLPTFLSRREVTLRNGVRAPVTLTATNVSELTSGGTTRVALAGGRPENGPNGDGRAVYVTLEARDGPVTSTSPSLAATGRAGGLRVLDGVPAGIHTIETPPVALPLLEFVVYLPYRQEWMLRGYSRGELINSIPLTPNEETTIEIETWDRRTRMAQVTTGEEAEATLDVTIMGKEAVEVVGELQQMNNWSQSGGGQVTLPPIEGLTAAGQFSTAAAGSIDQLNRATVDTITEASYSASARLKATRQTTVSEGREWGREMRVTRRLKNSNVCRTVTHDFFEVLASYRVTTLPLPDEMRLAVLVPNLLHANIDRHFLLRHEGVLRDSLLDDKLEGAFDAARTLASHEKYCFYKCGARCECDKPPELPPVRGNGAATPAQLSPAAAEDAVALAEAAVRASDQAVRDAIAAVEDATHRVASVVDSGGTQEQIDEAVREFHRWCFRKFGLEWYNPGFWGACREYARTQYSPEALERFLGRVSGSWLETLIAGTFALGLVLPWLGAQAVVWAFELGLKSGWYMQFLGWSDAGLGAAIDQARRDVGRWRQAVNARIATAFAGSGGSGVSTTGAALPPVVPEVAEIGTPPAFPPEELAAHDVAETALLEHVRANRGHYYAAIWRAMDPVDRLRALGVYGELGSILDIEVLGFVGDRIALPFQTWRVPGLEATLTSIRETVAAAARRTTRTLSVPTAGIDVTSRLGDCDVCEPFVRESREIDLQGRRADVRRSRLENDRYAARLRKQPPLLDDPDARSVPGST
jgi:hypothetical protein